MLTGIAVRRLVEGIGELPFLRLVAPLRRGVADDVVGTAGGADRRGTGGPVRHLPLDRLRPVLGHPVLGHPVLGNFERVDQLGQAQHRSSAFIREFWDSLLSKLANQHGRSIAKLRNTHVLNVIVTSGTQPPFFR